MNYNPYTNLISQQITEAENQKVDTLPSRDVIETEIPQQAVFVPESVEDIEQDDTLDLRKFQVARREDFYHVREPSLTFNNYKIGLNAACINRLPDVEYVQILVDREGKKIVIRPCTEFETHTFKWYTLSKGKKVPRHVTGKIFFMKICSLMQWNPDYRYKILGNLIYSNGQYLYVFDLNSPEMYQRIFKEGEKPKASRTPIFPAEWKDQFGLPYEEHRKSLQVDIFGDYAIYGIKDNTATPVTPVVAQDSPTHSAVSVQQNFSTGGVHP